MSKYTLEQLDKVFHAYDIRGLVEEQLDEEFFYNLGKSVVKFLDARRLAVGYDIRPDSKIFSERFIEGAIEMGCNIVSVGEIATEMIYFAVGADQMLDGGVTITASHNPAGWSGCKMVGKNVKAISKSWGLQQIKENMLDGHFEESATKGIIEIKDIYPDFKTKIRSIMGNGSKPLKVVVDAGNGIGGKIYDYVFGDLNIDLTKMYFEPDGNFPNHVPDPLKEENVKEIKERCSSGEFNLGIAIDGDADRVFFIDSKGRNPSGVFMSAIFAKYFAEKEKNAKIVHDPRVTWPVIKEIEKFGAVPLVNKAGHSFFKERMKNEDAVFGGEMSAHFFYRDFYYADSGMTTIALMYKLINEGLDLVKELDYFYSNYFVLGEVNYKVENPDSTIAKMKEIYREGKIEEIDGVSIEFDVWRFNLRKSNTEPLIRLNLEAKSLELVKEKFKELEKEISGIRQNLPSLKEVI